MRRSAVPVLFLLLFASRILAQAGNASLTGFIQDSSKAFISGVHVVALNTNTNQQFDAVTNKDGSYTISSLPVGPYRMQIDKVGFRTILKEGLFLHTQDVLQINFQMAVGSTSETITVSGADNNINTTDAAVSTVIDRQFVQDIPMNGRSFQTLVLLSPGVVTNTPQIGGASMPNNDQGEYSVNGMRTDANNFTVDGVSASNNPGYTSAAGSAGMLESSTTLGTTQAMLQVDSMEEFRISTSTYSAEYGRQPGAQISFRSRSGTNEFHGTLYDYLRNSVFDANNWFNTYSTVPIPTPAERQNDFGGTLGGPLTVPHLYSGKDRAFFFFGYEGLRLTQPQAAAIYYVPSNGTYNTGTYANPEYKNLRKYAPAALQPVLDAFPAPNCSTAQDPQCVDYGLGGSPYLQTAPSTGELNSINARIDYQVLPTMRIFARYGDTPSVTDTGGDATVTRHIGRDRVYLLGADNAFGASISNELRLQYSPAVFSANVMPVEIDGATNQLNIEGLEGLPPLSGESVVHISLPSTVSIYQTNFGSQQFQPDALDTVAWTHGRHLFKFGVDYRQTTAYYNNGDISRSPYVAYGWTSASAILSNTPSFTASNEPRVDPTSKNLGLFAQDEWRVQPRLSLSLGLRWDFNPPPSVSGIQAYTYTGNINDPSSLALSPKPGGPTYKTTWNDFAPRFGLAYTIRTAPGNELVLRTGAGLFYDLLAPESMFGNGTGVGTSATSTGKTAFPLTASQILVPIVNPPKPPYNLEFYAANNLIPPSAIEWNVTLEQALGSKQAMTLGYVASLGRNLTHFQEYDLAKVNPEFDYAYLFENGPGSNYNSLQVKYQRQMSHGVQALASYTWSHAIDWASTEEYSVDFPLQRGNSNFDVRSNFTAALVYNLPSEYPDRLEKAILSGWNTDLWFVARTAFPWEPIGPSITDPVTGDIVYGELNYNGKYPYVHKAGIPGGRQIDPTIFSVTTTPLGVGNAPRNFLRGFGEDQANLAVQRSFPIYERSELQFRAEAYNIANHPVFGAINTTCGVTTAGSACNNSIMGQATGTLSAGLVGLSPLYQQGGPRSLQFALKLRF
ncbi:MAG TPA: TonB-dependent receptor [Acidobacteriaceae bacterium]|nr:TonB-dependent receptor [Acidobacteriaceae bacterium]